jgi:oligoribonuclease
MARVWIDLETSALDPAEGYILEIAAVATDAEPPYTEVAHQRWVVRPGVPWPEFMAHLQANPHVFEMHTRSGLVDDLGSGVRLAEAEAGLVRFCRYFGNPAPGREPIAGSSPHFDLGWLQRHCPAAARYWSHRTFDVSSLKRFAKDCGMPDPTQTESSGGAAHRALADVRHSISVARAVAEFFLSNQKKVE